MRNWLKSLSVLLVLPGCVRYKETFYVHEPTAALRASHEIGAGLGPFTHQGVVISPGLSAKSHTARSLHLQMFATEPAAVRVQGWTLAPSGASSEAPRTGTVDAVVAVETKSKRGGAFTGFVGLADVPLPALEALFANGPCRLTVTVGDADPTAPTQDMVFELTRSEEESVGLLK